MQDRLAESLLAEDQRQYLVRSVLYDMWEELYEYISKKAAIDRKIWLKGLLQSHPPSVAVPNQHINTP